MQTLRGKRIYRTSKPIVVNAADVPVLFGEWAPALMAWKDYKTFGLPCPGGYKQQPAAWVAVMRVLEAESNLWTEEKSGSIGRAKNSSQSRSQ